MGVLPWSSGLFWKEWRLRASEPSGFWIKNAQPEPKTDMAFVVKASLNLSKLPKVELRRDKRGLEGLEGLGDIIFQKKEWLAWPPPWLMTAWRDPSGTLSIFFKRSSTGMVNKSS